MTPERHRLRARDVVRDRPNFRDHGRTVDRPLLNLLTRLQERWGTAYASEGGLRTMMADDTGHVPGVTTVAKALRRLGAQGLVVQVWLRAGQIMPDGAVATHGTRLVYVPKTRRQRRGAIAFYRSHDRRAGYETRHTGFRARELVERIATPLPQKNGQPRDAHADERARQLAAARAWIADEEKRGKDPPR